MTMFRQPTGRHAKSRQISATTAIMDKTVITVAVVIALDRAGANTPDSNCRPTGTGLCRRC
jgi:hypothetical protein